MPTTQNLTPASLFPLAPVLPGYLGRGCLWGLPQIPSRTLFKTNAPNKMQPVLNTYCVPVLAYWAAEVDQTQ